MVSKEFDFKSARTEPDAEREHHTSGLLLGEAYSSKCAPAAARLEFPKPDGVPVKLENRDSPTTPRLEFPKPDGVPVKLENRDSPAPPRLELPDPTRVPVKLEERESLTVNEIEKHYGVFVQSIGDKLFSAFKEDPDGSYTMLASEGSLKELKQRLDQKPKTVGELSSSYGVFIQLFQGKGTTYYAFTKDSESTGHLIGSGASVKDLETVLENWKKKH